MQSASVADWADAEEEEAEAWACLRRKQLQMLFAPGNPIFDCPLCWFPNLENFLNTSPVEAEMRGVPRCSTARQWRCVMAQLIAHELKLDR